MNLYERLFGQEKPGVWALIDPDSLDLPALVANAQAAEAGGATAILVGGSFISHDRFDETVRLIKETIKLPVILFPGNSRQLSRHADGMLFTSLLSGRNPQYLIGEQVMAAPLVMKMGLATIPTAYLLVESGRMTSAQFVSDTNPLPADKPALALAHAQAAKLLGMLAVYLEAGSGAERPVPPAMIRMLSKGVDLPVIVGGGIRCVEDGVAAIHAGARVVVVGTIIEKLGGGFVEELTRAIHCHSRESGNPE